MLFGFKSIQVLLILFLVIFLTLLIPHTVLASDPVYRSTKSIGNGSAEYVFAEEVVMDSVGNTYVSGQFKGTTDFNPSSEVDQKTSTGSTGDVFISKYTSDGSYLWTKTVGGGDSAWIFGRIAIDNNDNLYYTGWFYDTVDFNPSTEIDVKVSYGEDDIFISKYSPDGTYLWTRTIGGTGYDEWYATTIDAENNILITGCFESTVDFNPGNDTDIQSSHGASDIFITKIMHDGTYGWSRVTGSSSYDWGSAIGTDEAGGVYIGGTFDLQVDFDPGAGIQNKTAVGDSDLFVLKYDAGGNYQWVKTFGANSNPSLRIEALTVDQENLYLLGSFRNTVDFYPDAGIDNHSAVDYDDIFISKYTTDSAYRWTRTIGTDSSEYGKDAVADERGNIVIVGNNGDVPLIRSYDSSGNINWTHLIETVGGGWGSAYGIGYDISEGRLFVAGSFGVSLDFDPSGDSDILVSNPNESGFITRLDLDYPAPSIVLQETPQTIHLPSLDIVGSASDPINTVATVEYQPDGFSGTWTSCIAEDSSFDESDEHFSCNLAGLLDGSHVVYVRASDSSGNITAVSSYASVTFTVDTSSGSNPSTSISSSNNDSIYHPATCDITFTSNEVPTFVSSAFLSPSQLSLLFVPVKNVDGYSIYYGTDASTQYAVSFTNTDSSGMLSYTIRDLYPSTQWKLRLQAYRGCGTGAVSPEYTITTKGTGSTNLLTTVPSTSLIQLKNKTSTTNPETSGLATVTATDQAADNTAILLNPQPSPTPAPTSKPISSIKPTPSTQVEAPSKQESNFFQAVIEWVKGFFKT